MAKARVAPAAELGGMLQQEELASLISEASDKVVQQEELASLSSEASDKEKTS